MIQKDSPMQNLSIFLRALFRCRPVAPCAAELSLFADSPARRFAERAAALRRELGIADGEKVLLYAGAFTPEKRAAVLLDQFLEFRRTRPGAEWRFILAGQGPEEGMLRRMAASAQAAIHFLPLPEPSDLPVLYRAADLVALVSRSEAGTETVAGAMGCGRPVLASDGIGCASRLIEPAVNGWCVDSAHPELWFDYPGAASGERLKAMGRAAALKIVEKTGIPAEKFCNSSPGLLS